MVSIQEQLDFRIKFLKDHNYNLDEDILLKKLKAAKNESKNEEV